MRAKLAALIPLVLLPAAVLTGCGDDPPEPDGDRLDAGLGPVASRRRPVGPVHRRRRGTRGMRAAVHRRGPVRGRPGRPRRGAGARNLGRARAALLRKPATGHRAFGFVLSGCRETGSQLLISRTHLTARLTGGGNTVCEAAEGFLVVYDLPAGLVSPEVKLI